MASPVRTYAFINAKLRTRLSQILSLEFFESLARAHSLIDAVQLLKNTRFAALEDIYSRTGDIKSAELALFTEEVRVFLDVERRVEGVTRDFVHALAAYYEIENLKRAIRLWFDRAVRGRDVTEGMNYLSRETVHYELPLDALLGAADYLGIANALAGTPYARLFLESVSEIERLNSLFPFEISIDRYYYDGVMQAVDALSDRDARIARRLVGVEIDLLNINWIIRFKTVYNLPLADALRYAIPYGQDVTRELIIRAWDQNRISEVFDTLLKRHRGFTAMLKEQGPETTARLVLIERILEHVMEEEAARLLVGNPFTIGIVLAYFYLKKSELRRLLTVLNAKLYALKPEEIKSRL